jgi:nucleoside 2-deoxyribosyltransferase
MIGRPTVYSCENRPDHPNPDNPPARDPARARGNRTMRLYVAGPLFTQAERAWNQELAEALSAAGHSVFLPQTEIQSLERLEAGAIFRLDVQGIRTADAIVAILDGADADSGTCFECGLAYALQIPIVVVRTDFRGGGDALPGQALPAINLMLSQAASAIVALTQPAHSLDDVAAAVCRALSGINPGKSDRD